MFATLFSVTLLVAFLRTVIAQSDFELYTPMFTQCEVAEIEWTASQAPYDLVVVPADDECGPALEDLGTQNGLNTTFLVNIAAGEQVVLYIEDAAGNSAWSATVTVGSSSNTSCLPATSSGAPSVSPTTLSIPAQGGATPAGSASPSSSAFAPAGAANDGIVPTSGALSTRPLGAIAVVVSAFLGAVAFAL